MSENKIRGAIQKEFDSGVRIIFWSDPDREFENVFESLDLNDLECIRVDQEAALSVKGRVATAPTQKFLLYEPGPRPDPESDWLLDIRLWAKSFSADRASLLITELGLATVSLRDHIKHRAAFFASKERVGKLSRLVHADDDASDLDRKMLAVLLQAEPDIRGITIAVLAEMDPNDLESVPDRFTALDKYELTDVFWDLMERQYGYGAEQQSLKGLLLRLFVSEFGHATGGIVPSSMESLFLCRPGRANSAVCLDHWRDSASRSEKYEALSLAVAEEIRLDSALKNVPETRLVGCTTFRQIDEAIIRSLRDDLTGQPSPDDLKSMGRIISDRSNSFWVTTQRQDTHQVKRGAFMATYLALNNALELRMLAAEDGLNDRLESARSAFEYYQKHWYRFDQCYRYFCLHARAAAASDWDILKSLEDAIEDLYAHRYLARVGERWGELVDSGLLETWSIEGVPNQQRFFDQFVAPTLAQGDDRRVFVLISDALRYEAAEELTRSLNGRYRIKARLSAQLGVLPSYTKLGMASLLPHKELSYDDKGTVKVDGQRCGGLAERDRILKGVDGVAVKFDDFMKMTKDNGRAFVKPHRVVYIYHDHIDAMGDSRSTESRTFEAVHETIRQIGDAVGKIINSLNGGHVIVTADHGFLFQVRPPDETDKTEIKVQPENAAVRKKRYIIGKDLGTPANAYHGKTAITAGASGGMEFWIPRSNNRFHFVGGARFIHGGAMPQEVVVPVVQVHHQRGAKAEKTRTRTVGVSVLGNNFRITTNRHVFQLIQSEACTDRIKPVTLRVAVYDGDEPVTNVETLTFDETSSDLNAWKRTARLTLQSRDYDARREYHLLLREADSDHELGRYAVTIDLAFTNDF